MYNNEVTYDKKWDTPENEQALKELDELALKGTVCWSDCPPSWAVEVLALVKEMKQYTVEISQIKEKYGELRVYYSTDNDTDEIIDRLIRKCEVQLARKGAYSSLESMRDWSTTRYNGDEEIVTYPYREFLDEGN